MTGAPFCAAFGGFEVTTDLARFGYRQVAHAERYMEWSHPDPYGVANSAPEA